MSSEHTLSYRLRSLTFSLKLNKLPTFSEVWQWVKLCLYSQTSLHTEFQLSITF